VSDHHPDPGSEAAARAAQLAALAVTVAEAVARLRATRLADRVAADERAAAALRAQHSTQTATDQLHPNPFDRSTSGGGADRPDPAVTSHPPPSDPVVEYLSPSPTALATYQAARAQGVDQLPALYDALAAAKSTDEHGQTPANPTTGATAAMSPVTPTTATTPGARSVIIRLAYPVPITTAMSTAPAAAVHAVREIRALPAPPVRRQLTAAPATRH